MTEQADEVEYYAGDEEELHRYELRQAVEEGRRYKVAGEVLKGFLEDRRVEIINELEKLNYGRDIDLMRDYVSELKVMRKFRDICRMQIDLGELAEKELSMEYGE